MKNQEQINEIVVVGAEEVKPTTEKKKQKVSISYTLKSFKENIRKLVTEKIITVEDGEALKQIHRKAVEHWIGLEMDI